jgi:hypothetical protein
MRQRLRRRVWRDTLLLAMVAVAYVLTLVMLAAAALTDVPPP